MTTKKTIVIVQSNYIPWKGYFDLLAAADEFVIYDEVQYTRRDWRNRNKIIINGTPHWLTIPVQTKGNFDAAIDDIRVESADWAPNHWRTIELNYQRASHFQTIAPVLSRAYAEAARFERLSEINEHFLRTIAEILQIMTPMRQSRSISRNTQDPTSRLVEICKELQATDYISGPSASSYIKREQFEAAGIALHYANYSGYPVYEQKSSAFEHGVSIIDVLFRCGLEARAHLKSYNDADSFLDS